MAYATLNSLPIVAARIVQTLAGAWVAEIAVDARSVPSGRVTIAVAGGITLVGTAYRAGVTRDTALIRVVGGAGGLAQQLEAKFYRGVMLRMPLADILLATGETLSPATRSDVLAAYLPAWARARGKAGEAVKALATAARSTVAGCGWRVLADGTLWIGPETWPAVSLGHETLVEDPKAGWVEYGEDVAGLVPGVTLDGRRASKIERRITAEQIRLRVWFDDEVEADDAGTSLEALIRHLTSHVDYYAEYPARVYAQNADGTLELRPDDARLPGMSRVPIRYGLPGVSATVAAGARVHVAFEAGDPSKPVATLWESGTLVEMRFDGGTAGVARVGDAVDGGSFSALGVAPGLPIQFIYTPPGAPPLPLAPLVTIAAKVASGSAKVKA